MTKTTVIAVQLEDTSVEAFLAEVEWLEGVVKVEEVATYTHDNEAKEVNVKVTIPSDEGV